MTPPCVEPGCGQEGVVGLQGAWVCLDHFEARLQTMKAAIQKIAKVLAGETAGRGQG